MKRIFLAIKYFLKERFSLAQDQDNEHDIVDAIRKGVAFRGVNLWMLIFATFIASVGLNVNSTAVVIGAMLISPLMGPIMGLGLGAGINDIKLINNAAKNLLIAVTFSILTSALYFYFTPLTQAQSELLARTSPTFWDVLIALFGGLAGVFAGSSRDKGNAIPGVAIATALMPPLCTAGYGLATLNMNFFFGALYLFFINSVMISATTFIVVQFLNFKHAEYMDTKRATTVKRIIYGLVLLTIVPSVYFGYNIVRQSGFEIEANTYLKNEFSNESTYYVINKDLNYNKSIGFNKNQENSIILYVGGFMDSITMTEKQKALEKYKLGNTKLEIKQGTQLQEILKTEQSEMEKINLTHAKELNLKDSTIYLISKQMEVEKRNFYSSNKVLNELKVFYPNINEFSISEGVVYNEKDSSETKTNLVYIAYDNKLKDADFENIEAWLERRLDTKNIKIVK